MGNHHNSHGERHHFLRNRKNNPNTYNNNNNNNNNRPPPPSSSSSSSSSSDNAVASNRMRIPYGGVDSSLRGLAGQAEGFGRHAIGGLHGPIYHVTTLSDLKFELLIDDGPGSLRAGCRNKEPLWIVFDVSGTIGLSSYLNVSSYKTIDGRGQRVKITGKGLRLKECEHVIICNLEFEGGRGPDVDAIQIKPNSKHIWIDRCSLKDYDDGLIDITRQSTYITISRCHFSNHDKTMLIGADASHHGDRCMCVTIHHCFFDGTRQRHPRVRFAKVHLYNNYTRNWGIYAVCASVESQIYSQCNIYEAGQKKVAFKYLTEKAADKEESCTGCIISEGDLFTTGTTSGLLEATAGSSVFHPSQQYQTWTVEPPTEDLKLILQYCTGWQGVPFPPDNAPASNKMAFPYARVDSSLRGLAGQAEGFGRHAIGGLHGHIYHVTTLSDDGPGSLRAGCRKKEPWWIVFDVSGTIQLSSYLNVSSYKTIDGRGQRVKITGKGFRLKECEHVIICNLEFEGGRGPDVDAIQIKPNSKHIWIDRCSLKDYDDGLIDITRQSTNITISRCHFSNHDKTILIGADASNHGDRCMCVTIHHCFFDGTRQRHPRVRFAKVHLYNNYTRNWGIYAVCASVESQIYSQCNIYEAGEKKVAFKYLTEKAADKEEASTGCIISQGDLFVSGTKSGLLEPAAESSSFHPGQHYQTWTVEPPTEDLKLTLQHCTGWQGVPLPSGQ